MADRSLRPLVIARKISGGTRSDEGDFFCGDLFDNATRSALNALMNDRAAARSSVATLRRLRVRMVYPGQGPPFAGELLPVGASPAS